MLTISQAADEIGVSVDTIRRWEKKGLIKGTRSDKNYRLFKIDAVKRLHDKLSGKNTSSNYRILKAENDTELTSIDLFAGAGGTALGLENAGIKHLALNEWDKSAAATLRLNRPDWNVIEGDIAGVDFSEYEGKVDIVEGGFPCQSFSYAGKKIRDFEFVRDLSIEEIYIRTKLRIKNKQGDIEFKFEYDNKNYFLSINDKKLF